MQTSTLHLMENERSHGSKLDAGHIAGVDPTHVVQFYENDAYLAAAVSDFLAAGLRSGQPTLVIATDSHRDAFTIRLKAKGLDVERARNSGQLIMLGARDTLSKFMSGSLPDAQRFSRAMGDVFVRAAGGTTHTVTRVYGEMVDVLWKDGNREGAIRLEELWNDLAASHCFSLLCAYGMENFHLESDSPGFESICRKHAHVIPTERYTQASDDARLIEISILQQRANALEAEVDRRRQLEEQLRQAVAEREDLLMREQAARQDAESANRAKSEFLAVMSHELRTPLNAIGGYVQLVEMGVHGPVTETQREALERVQRSQRHLLSLINDMLNLVRVEMGRVEYVLEDIQLAPLISDVTSMVAPLFSEKKLTCEIAAPSVGTGGAPAIIRADREKVQQILLNLLSNAIKYTGEGGDVTVSATTSPKTPGLVCVDVRDSGIGIPVTKLDAIFEPFVQLATRPVAASQGVGLGLTISRDLARQMGGDITVASIPGEGTTFTLTLPSA